MSVFDSSIAFCSESTPGGSASVLAKPYPACSCTAEQVCGLHVTRLRASDTAKHARSLDLYGSNNGNARGAFCTYHIVRTGREVLLAWLCLVEHDSYERAHRISYRVATFHNLSSILGMRMGPADKFAIMVMVILVHKSVPEIRL